MREIKFRAWIKDENIMVQVKSLHLGTNKIMYGISGEYHYGNITVSIDKVKLMQYTGLKDKNGKEIYEGDIIKINVAGVINKRVKVVCENGAFGVYWKAWGEPREELHYFNSFCNTEFEVLGNIYENPELLGDD